MDRRNLAAHTTSGCNYPSYISINELDQLVEITVRGPRKEDESCGETVAIILTASEFVELLEQANSNFQIRTEARQ